jgi:hypothetical protein
MKTYIIYVEYLLHVSASHVAILREVRYEDSHMRCRNI